MDFYHRKNSRQAAGQIAHQQPAYHRRTSLALPALAFLLALLATPALGAVAVGQQAPEISAQSWLNTQPLTLAGLRGQVTVVEFWATWCGPCRTSIPHLNELHQRFSPQGVTIIGLTNEDPRQVDVEGFARELDMQYPVAMGSQSINDYGVTGIPHAFVVNREGIVVWRGHPMAGLDQVIEEVLAGTFNNNPYANAQSRPAVMGSPLRGMLGESGQIHEGRYFESYTVSVNARETLRISAESAAFDTTLTVILPATGDLAPQEFNDDAAPGSGLARNLDSLLMVTPQESGTLQVIVSSYGARESGAFTLNIRKQ